MEKSYWMTVNNKHKKINLLVALALIFFQSPVVVKSMTAESNLSTISAPTEEQEITHQSRSSTTLATATAEDERPREHSEDPRSELSEKATPTDESIITRPPLAKLYDTSLTLSSKEMFFGHEDFFFKTIEAIAQNQNNLTCPETLRESVKNILSLSAISKKQRSYLNLLLRKYTRGNQDQAPRGIKIIRYITSKINPELYNEALLLNSFKQAFDFFSVLNSINRLTHEQIKQGSLINNETILGQKYSLICGQNSSIVVKKFFSKVIEAFAEDEKALKQALTQRTHQGLTPLSVAAKSNNPEVINVLFNSLKEVFTGNQRELQQALIQPTNTRWTALHSAARWNNNPLVIEALFNALKLAFSEQSTELQQLLTQQNSYGNTALQNAFLNNNSEVATTLLAAYQNAFTDNQRGLQQALIQQNNDNSSLLHDAFFNNNIQSAVAFFALLEEAFSNNLVGLQQALAQQDNLQQTPLHKALIKNNYEIFNTLLSLLEKAFINNQTGLQQVFITQNIAGYAPLHLAVSNNNADITKIFIISLKKAFLNNQIGLQQALTQSTNNGHKPLSVAILKLNFEIISIFLNELFEAFIGNEPGLDEALRSFYETVEHVLSDR